MKTSRMRRWIAMAIAALMLLAATGCSSTPTATEAPDSAESTESAAPTAEAAGEDSADAGEDAGSYRDELHIAMSSEPTNLDVTTNTATVATQVAYGTIFEGLVTMDSAYGAVPELCESWEISDDSTEYTWHLRQGVLFHNGEEMTAEDAAASLNRWLASAGNAQSMIGDATFEAADTYTVTLKMENPCAYVNELMAGLGQRAVIMPKSVL
ncbi:MAG: ABC transporter substrate-binding protein, partial [Candidatus Spyradocola sp.]